MEQQLIQLSYTLADIDNAAKQFWEAAKAYQVFAFSGEMGAGKTTFIHKLCDYLKVQDVVSSPTFALINEYHFMNEQSKDETIYHLDWYRLRDAAEAVNAGMEDCLLQAIRGKARCFVEWPEKAPGLLQPPFLYVSIKTPDDITKREMTVKLVQ